MVARIIPYIRLMRLHHYTKNLFIFLPLFFSGRMREWLLIRSTLSGFVAFCLVSSAVYIFNDIMDADDDRRHSVKSSRPIASGVVSVRNALILAFSLLALSFACQYKAGFAALLAGTYLYFYLLMNIAYSWRLKRVPILDVAILAAGFLLRLADGAALTGIPISGWLFLTVLTMSFYMGLGKRRGELLRQKDTRQVLKSYSQAFLDQSMNMCLTLTIAFYSLWAAEIGEPVSGGARHSGGLLWTVPVAVLICLKYNLDLEGDSDGDPVEVVLRDKALCAMVLLLAAMVFIMMYIL
ncbi:MAG: UbiA prenyltransferase family protein [Peptococcaceae bacterium]|nr:UbiA prenyltransferase family protein [Peptococcaceae bacterium]